MGEILEAYQKKRERMVVDPPGNETCRRMCTFLAMLRVQKDTWDRSIEEVFDVIRESATELFDGKRTPGWGRVEDRAFDIFERIFCTALIKASTPKRNVQEVLDVTFRYIANTIRELERGDSILVVD